MSEPSHLSSPIRPSEPTEQPHGVPASLRDRGIHVWNEDVANAWAWRLWTELPPEEKEQAGLTHVSDCLDYIKRKWANE